MIVCAPVRRDVDRYRWKPPSPQYEKNQKAEFSISDRLGVAAETERAEVGGRPSNRMMLRLKIKF